MTDSFAFARRDQPAPTTLVASNLVSVEGSIESVALPAIDNDLRAGPNHARTVDAYRLSSGARARAAR